MEQKSDKQKHHSIEAEIALLKFKEKGEALRKTKSTWKIKICATILFLLVTLSATNIFSSLNWPSKASGKFLGIGAIGLFVILFSENLGKYKGNLWLIGRIGTSISEETPAGALRFLGWIFIFVPIIIALLSLISA